MATNFSEKLISEIRRFLEIKIADEVPYYDLAEEFVPEGLTLSECEMMNYALDHFIGNGQYYYVSEEESLADKSADKSLVNMDLVAIIKSIYDEIESQNGIAKYILDVHGVGSDGMAGLVHIEAVGNLSVEVSDYSQGFYVLDEELEYTNCAKYTYVDKEGAEILLDKLIVAGHKYADWNCAVQQIADKFNLDWFDYKATIRKNGTIKASVYLCGADTNEGVTVKFDSEDGKLLTVLDRKSEYLTHANSFSYLKTVVIPDIKERLE